MKNDRGKQMFLSQLCLCFYLIFAKKKKKKWSKVGWIIVASTVGN